MLFVGMLLITIGLFLLSAWLISAHEDAERAGVIDFTNWNDGEGQRW